jgi:hypothetical protein
MCTFATRAAPGETEPGQTSIYDYYYKRHMIKIKDTKQCLLVSRVKNERWNPATQRKEKREDIVKLVPELCSITGNAIKDNARNAFNFQRDLDSHTKMKPHVRFQNLMRFLGQVNNVRESRAELESWDMRLSEDLMSVRGKRLATVEVFFGRDHSEKSTDQGWDRAMRDVQMLRSVPLETWLLIYARRDENEARSFEREVISLASRMGFHIQRPTW